MNVNGVNVYTSNRLDILAEKFSELIRKNSLKNPFSKEIISVQSKGMEKWLSLELAKNFRIWSNYKFYFPNQLVSELINFVIPGKSNERFLEEDLSIFRIMKILPPLLDLPSFNVLNNYFGDENNQLKLYQLSKKIAEIFDQYLTYRPDMILKWNEGGIFYDDDSHEEWQKELWLSLIEEMRSENKDLFMDPPTVKNEFIKLLNYNIMDVEKIPERITIFGISYLPKFHLEILINAAKMCEVNFFLFNPSPEFWADIKSQKMIAGSRLHGRDEDDYHYDTGNSLLSSMGDLGKEFFGNLIDEDLINDPGLDYINPGNDSILSIIQSDIFSLIDRGSASKKESKAIEFTIKDIERDDSLIVNSCHNQMREVEILYDYLLDQFNQDKELEPKDILVIAPGIDEYAPYINGQFGRAESDNKYIPYTIVDKNIRKESDLVEILFKILDLNESRFYSQDIIDILYNESVMNSFDLSNSDVDIIREYIINSGISWGINEEQKEDLGLPPFKQDTWEYGINRILLGYAMPVKDKIIYDGILPFDDIEGENAEIFGKFLNFFDSLKDIVLRFHGKFTLKDWSYKLNELVNVFFINDNDNIDIERSINRLRIIEEGSGYIEKVDLLIIKSFLDSSLSKVYSGSSFITGKLTFAAMLPMRSIPYKIICMIGMNNKEFPRLSKSPAFDLIGKYPIPGDRSLRNEDRYLFLESIISAQKKIYISYIGQGVKDNSIIPPSVLVSELTDYIKKAFLVEDEGENRILDFINFNHKLQSFNKEYFLPDGKFYSYSLENLKNVNILNDSKNKNNSIIIKNIPSLNNGEIVKININDLIKFFRDPIKFYLNKIFNIYLEDKSYSLKNSEIITLDHLSQYFIRQDILESLVKGDDFHDYYNILLHKSLIPQGNVGIVKYEEIKSEMEDFYNSFKNLISGNEKPYFYKEIYVDNFIITGNVGDIWDKNSISFSPSKYKATDAISAWIKHLFINYNSKEKYQSYIIRKDKKKSIDFVSNMDDIFRELLSLYSEGHSRPLKFFPESSYQYAEKIFKGKDIEYAKNAALNSWQGGFSFSGEKDKSYIKYLYSDIELFTKEFIYNSNVIYNQLFLVLKDFK